MGSRLLSVEHPPLLRTELPKECDVVLPIAGTRQQRAPTAIEGACGGETALRLRAPAYSAHARGLEGRTKTGPSAVQARGTPGSQRVRRRKRISLHRGPVLTATSGRQYWAMDFVHDQLSNGRKFRVLTVIDKWPRQCVALQADFALTLP